MSEYEQKDNSGALFVNDKKETENHPDRKGSAKIGGVDYWVSGWVNESKNGTKYMSMKFTEKEEAKAIEAKQAVEAPSDDLDDLPF